MNHSLETITSSQLVAKKDIIECSIINRQDISFPACRVIHGTELSFYLLVYAGTALVTFSTNQIVWVAAGRAKFAPSEHGPFTNN